MHSIVTTFREAVIKVEAANFGAAMDTLIDQDGLQHDVKDNTPFFWRMMLVKFSFGLLFW